MRRDRSRANQTHSTNRHCRVLVQTPWALRVYQDRDKTLHDISDERFELRSYAFIPTSASISNRTVKIELTIRRELQSDLSHSPSSVVANANLGILRVGQYLRDHELQDLVDVGLDQGKGGDGDISEKGES